MQIYPAQAAAFSCKHRCRSPSNVKLNRSVLLHSTTNSNNNVVSSTATTQHKTKHITRFFKFATKFIPTSGNVDEMNHTKKSKSISKVNITTLEQLNSHWEDRDGLYRTTTTTTANSANSAGTTNHEINYDTLLRAANVVGDTQMIGSKEHFNYTHPVVQLLHLRKKMKLLREDPFQFEKINDTDKVPTTTIITTVNRTSSMATTSTSLYNDHCKVALAIEGGGMRGCVSAGMVCAIHYLNLTETIDVVYGSSAGTIVGAYLISKQLPYFGPEIYYDRLTTAGKQFIDTKRLLRAIGFGMVDPRLVRDILTRRRDGGKPVLNLPFLLKRTVQETKPLDWDLFAQRQSIQPLHIVTSGLNSQKSIVFSMANNGFQTLEELTDCMHASCLLPGIAGPIMNLDKSVIDGTGAFDPTKTKKLVVGNNLDPMRFEPIADALLYEPLPYQTAITEDNVTHCIVLRTRPDGTDVTGKGGMFEKLIAKRFFRRKNKLAHQYERMRMHLHKKIYGANIIELNEAAYSLRDCYDTTQPHLMTVAIPPGSREIARLEVGRKAIFEGMRRGFARAYDCLVEDPNERGRGVIIAQEFFPDEILDYDPLLVDSYSMEMESAFDAYRRKHGVIPKAWKDSAHSTQK
jgi:predicted acylesterase/phospholipase RssA